MPRGFVFNRHALAISLQIVVVKMQHAGPEMQAFILPATDTDVWLADVFNKDNLQ